MVLLSLETGRLLIGSVLHVHLELSLGVDSQETVDVVVLFLALVLAVRVPPLAESRVAHDSDVELGVLALEQVLVHSDGLLVVVVESLPADLSLLLRVGDVSYVVVVLIVVRRGVDVAHAVVPIEPVVEAGVTEHPLTKRLLGHVSFRTEERHGLTNDGHVSVLSFGSDDVVVDPSGDGVHSSLHVAVALVVELLHLVRNLVVVHAIDDVVLVKSLGSALVESLQLLELSLAFLLDLPLHPEASN